MAHPTWLAYGFAVLMVTVSVYCIGRLAVAKRWGRSNHHDVNISHVVMGLAMVGMLVPRWNVIPDALWELVFGIISLWFLTLSVRFIQQHGVGGTDGDHVHHLSHYLIHMVMGCAMLYMYWLGMPITASPTTGASMTSGPPTGAGDPGLTLLIIAVLLASAVWQLDSITEFSPGQLALSVIGTGDGPGGGRESRGSERRWLAPRLEVACHIAMCLTMGYMLVLMV
jgi:steroid 5-alpha reductase family enzyme